ncbi:hypothetical protein Gasu2_58530 [Galdieria sulphuraria]|uniref:Archaeal ATPase n=1 Tax=Galdieria sulphuraria TaxID=130081 RepID=M2WV81_GALSU|nr:archaeal ATPase [Galdieria sulphuraria]EME27865.1 archaeal ATPase [Galdieria sulphuraria]GJD11725.1 hypothetical protein Gasu2_58530 [Galdieria sulphuraria]|eukprot:XP_005704385.1 archaeal ATPase [Galdieria sulphuraria]
MSSEFEPETVYDMVVVHRENDVRVVTLQLFQLYTLRKLGPPFKPVIPVGPHLFGSGKTKFIQSYLELLSNVGESALIGLNDVGESEKSNRRGFLKKPENTSLLFIDPRKLEPIRPIEEKRNLEWALYFLFYRSACDQTGLPFMKPDDEAYGHIPPYPKLSVVLELRKTLSIPFDQYLLVVFDESSAKNGKRKMSSDRC